ncbi:MAG TPA: hypothetical protein DEO39_04720 [Clostridiales bacterium]|nr:hypothetical protein [Clostridiales bacterium]
MVVSGVFSGALVGSGVGVFVASGVGVAVGAGVGVAVGVAAEVSLSVTSGADVPVGSGVSEVFCSLVAQVASVSSMEGVLPFVASVISVADVSSVSIPVFAFLRELSSEDFFHGPIVNSSTIIVSIRTPVMTDITGTNFLLRITAPPFNSPVLSTIHRAGFWKDYKPSRTVFPYNHCPAGSRSQPYRN